MSVVKGVTRSLVGGAAVWGVVDEVWGVVDEVWGVVDEVWGVVAIVLELLESKDLAVSGSPSSGKGGDFGEGLIFSAAVGAAEDLLCDGDGLY